MANWYDKIMQGMSLIREGCIENTSWNDCINCPCNNICDILIETYKGECYWTVDEIFEQEMQNYFDNLKNP